MAGCQEWNIKKAEQTAMLVLLFDIMEFGIVGGYLSKLCVTLPHMSIHSRSQTSLFLLVFSRPIAYLQAGHTGTLLCICLLVALPPNPRSAHSFVLWLRIFLRKDAIFKKPYLRKMPLSFLLLLCGLISLFHWFVQNSLHVRPNGQQFAHLILCVSILGIILFSLHCQDFIFRLQRLNSRELRQFSLIKSGSVKFFL